MAAEQPHIVLGLDPGGGHRFPVALFAQFAVGEKPPGKTHAAHGQAFQRPGLPFPQDQLGRPPADIDHQTRCLRRLVGGHAPIDQTGFLDSADNVNRRTQDCLAPGQKSIGVFRRSQRIGTHHTNLGVRCRAQALGKTLQTGERPLHGFGGQRAVFLQTGSQAYHLLVAIQDIHPALTETGHQQMETVGAEIQSGVGGWIVSQ